GSSRGVVAVAQGEEPDHDLVAAPTVAGYAFRRVLQVSLHRLGGQTELPRDRLVAQTARHQLGNLPLPRSQLSAHTPKKKNCGSRRAGSLSIAPTAIDNATMPSIRPVLLRFSHFSLPAASDSVTALATFHVRTGLRRTFSRPSRMRSRSTLMLAGIQSEARGSSSPCALTCGVPRPKP